MTTRKPLYFDLTFMASDPEREDGAWVKVEAACEAGHYEPACFSGSPDNWTPDGSADPSIRAVRYTTEAGERVTLEGPNVPAWAEAAAIDAWWTLFHDDRRDDGRDYG